MHRSGTSLLTAGLSACGINTGDELLPGNEFNLKGHFEDSDIVAFNNRVFDYLEIKWDSNKFISKNMWSYDSVKDLVHEGKALIQRKISNKDNFCFKDPRTIRVMPLWELIFEELEIQPIYIYAFRNPADVAHSLVNRDGMSTTSAQLLWLQYNLGSLECLLNKNCYFIDFYDFCNSPSEVLTGISRQFLSQVNDDVINQFDSKFFEASLISQQTSPYELSLHELMLTIVFDTYRALRNHIGYVRLDSSLVNISILWKTAGPLLIDQHKKLTREFILSNAHDEKESNLLSNQNIVCENLSTIDEGVNKTIEMLSRTNEEMSGVSSTLASLNIEAYYEDCKANFKVTNDLLCQITKKAHSDLKVSITKLVNEETIIILDKFNSMENKLVNEESMYIKEKLASIQNNLFEIQENISKKVHSDLNTCVTKLVKGESTIIKDMFCSLENKLINEELVFIKEKLASIDNKLVETQKNKDNLIKSNVLLQRAIENKNRRVNAMELELKAFKSSLSWKVTSPLRKLFQIFKF